MNLFGVVSMSSGLTILNRRIHTLKMARYRWNRIRHCQIHSSGWLTQLLSRLAFGLGTCILIVPQRNPLILAKELATLDQLSGGKVELGLGVGWMKEEFDASRRSLGTTRRKK